MDDVGAWRPLLDASDPVIRERRPELIEHFKLGAFAVLVGRFLLKAPLHVLQLLLKLHFRFEIFRALGVNGRDLVFLQHFALMVDLVRVGFLEALHLMVGGRELIPQLQFGCRFRLGFGKSQGS
jgi:hypothetical protein